MRLVCAVSAHTQRDPRAGEGTRTVMAG